MPRRNGSEALLRVADYLQAGLDDAGAHTSRQLFTATPHGFELVWTAALALMLGWAAALLARRHGLALVLAALAPLLLLLEFEWMFSPVSGLWPLEEANIVGSWPGRPDAPLLVFTAHYDTATHFGDHFTWARWGWRLGPATGAALALPFLGLLLRRRGRELPRMLAAPLAALVLVPFAAMWTFHALGPHLREPSPGAIDNGGSLAALLRLAQRLDGRAPDAAVSVEVVFLAAEEERALGSLAQADALASRPEVAVVNLESIGASDAMALVVEDGWAMRRVASPPRLVDFVNRVAEARLGAALPELALPEGVLTDGRSFLARGVPAVTLRALSDGAFPRHLHSARDSRERLSLHGIERAVTFLAALVARAEAHPEELSGLTPLPARR